MVSLAMCLRMRSIAQKKRSKDEAHKFQWQKVALSGSAASASQYCGHTRAYACDSPVGSPIRTESAAGGAVTRE